MDNMPKSVSLQHTAMRLFQWIDGQAMDEQPEPEVSTFFSGQAVTPVNFNAENPAAFQMLLDQPRIPEIIWHWRPLFAATPSLSPKQATRFIQQVLGAFESVDFLMDYRCTGGYTEANKGQWNDYPVYRPGRKRGWGIHLTCKGAAIYNCLRRTLEVGAGDLVLLAPDAFYDYGRSSSAPTWRVYWAAFQADKRIADLLNWPEVGAGIYHLRCDKKKQLEQLVALFDEIRQLSRQSDAETIRLRSNLVEQLLLRCQSLIAVDARGGMDRRVQTAIAFIESNFTRDISIGEVAAAASVSISTLTRLFKQHTGLTVLAWRDEKRLALACEKLTHSSLRIAAIAERIGYPDQLYFSRCFRRHFGQSPSDYRKQFLSA